MLYSEIKEILDEKVAKYNNPDFIQTDPIQIPREFLRKEDIEIAGFLAATLAWGQRQTIIKNGFKLMQMMDNDPYYFLMDTDEHDWVHLLEFKHRTFNGIDCVFFIKSLQNIYKNHGGLEAVFTKGFEKEQTTASALKYFREVFFDVEYATRTQKHVANITKGASAKRLNMYLRWMVRKDNRGVDFGIWKNIPMRELLLPLDVHTGRVARSLGLLNRKQDDWKAVLEVTENLRLFDSNDPIKYDFALFGIGAFEDFI